MKLHHGWVMVAIGALMTCVAIGAMFSLAVFLEPMTRDTGWSRAGVSSAMTLNFLAMGIAGFGWSALSRRKHRDEQGPGSIEGAHAAGHRRRWRDSRQSCYSLPRSCPE